MVDCRYFTRGCTDSIWKYVLRYANLNAKTNFSAPVVCALVCVLLFVCLEAHYIFALPQHFHSKRQTLYKYGKPSQVTPDSSIPRMVSGTRPCFSAAWFLFIFSLHLCAALVAFKPHANPFLLNMNIHHLHSLTVSSEIYALRRKWIPIECLISDWTICNSKCLNHRV